MRYYRYGHAKEVFVKTGDTVKKGQKIGTIGDGNGQWSSHLHFDIPKKNLQTWTNYVFGMTKNAVRNLYADPAEFRKTVYPLFDHFGWQYLEKANYSGKYCYHPGEDLNGKGAGHSDKGTPFYSATNGIVVYCYAGTGSNAGWGKLIVIQEIKDDSSSKNAPTTNETEKVVSTPISTKEDATEQTEPSLIGYPEIGVSISLEEVVRSFEEGVRIEEKKMREAEAKIAVPSFPDINSTSSAIANGASSIIYTAKPLDPPSQSRLERFVNWFLGRLDRYRDILRK